MYTTQILFTFLFDLCFSQLIVVSTITGHPLRANNIYRNTKINKL